MLLRQKKKNHQQKQISDGRMGKSGMFVRMSSFKKGELVLEKVLDPQERDTD